MDEIKQAQKFFSEDAMTQAVAIAEAMVAEGTAIWVLDPSMDKVVGLVHADKPNLAYVVVYLPGSLVAAGGPADFECSDEFDEMVYKSRNS